MTLLLLSFTGCSDKFASSASSSSGSDSSVSSGSASVDTKLEQTDFNLGYLKSTAHLLGFVAKEEGFFDEEGLNVTLTQF